MQIGSLVRAKCSPYGLGVGLPEGIGIVTKITHGYERIVYVHWPNDSWSKPRPVNVIHLEALCK